MNERPAQTYAWWRRSVMAGPLVAALTVLAALLATDAAGVPFRDPDQVVGRRLAMVACLVLLLVGIDIAIRACRRSRTLRPSRAQLAAVRRDCWPRHRGLAVGCALVCFYVTYLAYRNLKSIVPVLRPGEGFDRQLADADRALFGSDPAALLHAALGTGLASEVLSIVYVVFIVFLPLSLALALVFSPDVRGAIFYATALSINWGLGAAAYFLLPALGPIYATPGAFAELPATEVSRLQGLMLEQRVEFLRDPSVADASQNIGAFASLHISMLFTAAVAAHMLGLGRRVRIGLWLFFALSALATIHLGWHYVVDDLAGLVIGLAALVLGRWLTGFRRERVRPALKPSRRPRFARSPAPAPALPATHASRAAEPRATTGPP